MNGGSGLRGGSPRGVPLRPWPFYMEKKIHRHLPFDFSEDKLPVQILLLGLYNGLSVFLLESGPATNRLVPYGFGLPRNLYTY